MENNKLIQYLRNHKATLGELSNKFKVTQKEIQEKIGVLREKGIQVSGMASLHNKKDYFYHINLCPDQGNVFHLSGPDKRKREVKFAATSDWHFSSKYHLAKSWHESMKKVEDMGIRKVYVAGDVVDGTRIYKGHLENVTTVGIEDQTDEAAEAISKHPNLEFMAIAGNHDYSFTQQNGAKPMALLEAKLDNFTNLGDFRADIVYKGVRMRMLHGAAGRAYAKCFDEETEILTDVGWKFFKDLNKSEKVATLNLDKNLFEWQKPTHWTNEEFEGKLIHFENRCTDLLVTPNHRMLIRHTPSKANHKEELEMPQKSHKKRDIVNWRIKEAKELLEEHSRQKFQMRRGGQSWEGKEEDELYAELLAWYVTEGSIDKGRALSISQYQEVNPENWDQIKQLIEKLGFKPGIHHKYLRLYNKEMCQRLIKDCGVGSYNKSIPKFLKEASPKILKVILETCIKGDGWTNGQWFGYKSYSKQLLDDVGEIAHKLGYAVTYNYKNHSVFISQVQIYPSITNEPEEVDYTGKVYCVSVPNSIVLVRRNGRAIWSGNSYPSQTYLRDFFSGLEHHELKETPQLLMLGHFHTLYNGFDHGMHVLQPGSFQDSDNEYCIRKGLTGPTGLYAVSMQVQDGEINEFETRYITPKSAKGEKGVMHSRNTRNYRAPSKKNGKSKS